MQQPRRLGDLLDPRALLHRVEDPLRPRFGAKPRRATARGVQGPRDRGGHLVGPQQALERNDGLARLHQPCEPFDPVGFETEDVVGDPQMIGLIGLLEPRHLVDDVLGRARGVALAVNRLRAPVAVVRAAARRDDVHREIAVMRSPDGAIPIDVHEIPRGKRQRLEAADDLARPRAHDAAVGAAQPEAVNRAQLALARARHRVEQLDERHLAFAGDDDVGAAVEIRAGMIARVGAGDDRRDAARLRGIDHGQRGLAHAQQAHLAEIVEVVFVDHREARPMAIERGRPLPLRRREHRVEQRDAVAALADTGRRVERAERRVGLLRLPELRVESKEIRLAEEHVDGGRCGRLCGGDRSASARLKGSRSI